MASTSGQPAVGPIRPEITSDNEAFWVGCSDGRLVLVQCDDCAAFQHPPRPICRHCHGRNISHVAVAPEGSIYSLTISHQAARADLPAPYALALVDLDAAPGVRLTLRVQADDPAAVHIGQEVRIEFDSYDDGFAVPVAIPLPDVDARHHSDLGELRAPRLTGDKPETRAVISGLGQSVIGRKLFRSDMDLTLEAALRAVVDAGLRTDQIDGIAAYPGAGLGPPGYAGPHTDEVADALGLELRWHRAGAEGAGQLQPVVDAVLAVAGGLADHVLVYRTATESSVMAAMRDGTMAMPAPTRAGGFTSWLLPFDSVSPANWLAPFAARHQHQFGTTRAQLGEIALVARANAARNLAAVMTEPMTMDGYLAARPISTPLHLLDCDVPVDGSTAVIVSRADAAADLPNPAVRFEALGTGVGLRPSWDQWPDMTTMAALGAAATMWARTDLTPDDVDVAQLYDGFTFLALFWLEAMGFCPHGDAGAFVEGGGRIALDGELPLNTGGGQLSGGRLHGWGLLHEACLQLRGQAEGRQVADAEVAAVSTGGGPVAGCLLLTR